MWNPDFAFVSAHPARLYGYHRSFCIRSISYRGTPERPGLVFGLDSGGSCVGRVYEVADRYKAKVLDYLAWRELRIETYVTRRHPVWIGGRKVEALCFVVNRYVSQYMGRLSVAAMATYVDQGVGERGPCFDYLESTVTNLRELGVHDHALERLLKVAAKQREKPKHQA
ncbi:MAG: gamma-glutamylcyclotransferase [Alphaproteobacteria bacterium]|nr:gamma-glutamylcyclotransferase [Alphaproteobacteria bacterium]